MMLGPTADITIDDLYTSCKLSTRSMNICRKYGLSSRQSIMAHYSYYRTFLSLKGCGNTCNQELISFCEQYYEPVINFAEFNDENPHPITDIRKSGKVSALKKMDWQGITIQAMNAISRPRSVKEISEEIARYYKSLPMSTICSQVNQSLAAALREGCIGTIPKVKQKYFLK